jgi:hypothetical protein
MPVNYVNTLHANFRQKNDLNKFNTARNDVENADNSNYLCPVAVHVRGLVHVHEHFRCKPCRKFDILIERGISSACQLKQRTPPFFLYYHAERFYIGRRLDIPTGRQTYRAFKVKLIISVINDEKTKNVITFSQYFLFKHILN